MRQNILDRMQEGFVAQSSLLLDGERGSRGPSSRPGPQPLHVCLGALCHGADQPVCTISSAGQRPPPLCVQPRLPPKGVLRTFLCERRKELTCHPYFRAEVTGAPGAEGGAQEGGDASHRLIPSQHHTPAILEDKFEPFLESPPGSGDGRAAPPRHPRPPPCLSSIFWPFTPCQGRKQPGARLVSSGTPPAPPAKGFARLCLPELTATPMLTVLTLQSRQPRHREVKHHAQSHTAMEAHPGFQPSALATKPELAVSVFSLPPFWLGYPGRPEDPPPLTNLAFLSKMKLCSQILEINVGGAITQRDGDADKIVLFGTETYFRHPGNNVPKSPRNLQSEIYLPARATLLPHEAHTLAKWHHTCWALPAHTQHPCLWVWPGRDSGSGEEVWG